MFGGGWRGGGLLVLSWFTGCVSFYRCFKVCVGLCVFLGGLGGLLLLFGGGWRVGRFLALNWLTRHVSSY